MTQTRKEKLKETLKVAKEEFSRMVATFAETHPQMTMAEIGTAIGIHRVEVLRHCKQHNVIRARGKASPAYKEKKSEETEVQD